MGEETAGYTCRLWNEPAEFQVNTQNLFIAKLNDRCFCYMRQPCLCPSIINLDKTLLRITRE